MTRRLECLVLAAFLIGLAAVAYPADDDYMRLARLSYMEGHVSFQYASDVEWSAASINMPLEPGDRIYTGRDGRAEIQFDEGSVYRLAEDTDVEILSLSEHLIQLRILVGLSSLTVSSGLGFEINTPAAAFITIRQGAYRFEVGENGQTSAIVRKGELEAANNEFVRRIHSGERLNLHLGGGTELVRYNGRDSWDEWNDRRNADKWAYTSREYLPDTVYIGISDLDRYGRWVHVGSYGAAWVPFSVGVSWSPYSVGRWCYRPYYGWTWISYEPWGWLPYHYGRWYRSASFGWCWLPGPSFSFNFWSPGLVAFYSGPGWVSWCPLGPGDYYNINNYYFNRTVYHYQLPRLRALHTRAAGRPFYRNDRGAFRGVPLDEFRNGSLRGNGVATPRGYVNLASREGSYVEDRLEIQPSRASYSGAPDRAASRPNRTRTLPAVVRNDPEVKARNRGGFTRVTNPEVTASPARVARNRNEANTRSNGTQSDPSVRNIEFGSAEQTNQRARSQSRNGPSEVSSQRTAAPRTSRSSTSASTSGSSTSARRSSSSSAARTPSTARTRTYSAPSQSSSSVQRNSTTQSSSQARPRVEERRQVTTPAPSSSSSARRSSSSSAARTPSTARTRTYSAPSQSGSSVQRNSTTPSSSQARPRVEERRQVTTPAPSSSSTARRSSSSSTARAPATARTRTYSAPSQSGSSVQRNSTTPSSSQARPRVEERRQVTTPAPSSSSSVRRSPSSSSTVRAPSAARTRTYSAPRQSSSSIQRNSISGSARAPSSTRSAQPSVRSSGGSASSRSSGQAQRRSSGSSSGSARRR